jgi:hypothetical protein
MVVDAQVDGHVGAASIASALAHDEDRSRLPPAPIAAGTVSGLQRGEQSLREFTLGPLERLAHGVDDIRAREDVALAAVAVARPAPGPVETFGTGECCRDAGRVHDAELTVLALIVVPGQHPDDRVRRHPLLQQLESFRTVRKVRECLRRHSPGPGSRPWNGGTDGQELGRDRDPPLVRRRVGIPRGDREGHGGNLTPTCA